MQRGSARSGEGGSQLGSTVGNARARLRRLAGDLLERQPQRAVKRGTDVALRALALVVFGLFGLGFASPWGVAVDVVAAVVLGVLLLGLVDLLVGAHRALLPHLPRYLTWEAITTALGLLAFSVLMLPPQIGLPLLLPAMIVVGALGGSIAYLWSVRASPGPWHAMAVAIVVTIGGLAACTWTVWWLASAGTDAQPSTFQQGTVRLLDAPDPSLRGPYPVAALTYGSGGDRHRQEYAGGISLATEAVDGRPFLDGVPGWKAGLRSRYWGFGLGALPLDARVWYPEGEGAFPLALIVHGNHTMMRASDPGYAWLGEHLASRGFIVASVDQNFLNGAPLIGDLSPENDARAWLLLEHLKLWREWNADADSPFFGRVDLSNVALIGHSRGGEAAAIAAAFDRLPYYPDDASVAFDYGFGIRSVIAIAPSDGQYRPADRFTPLTDVNYLVLQGGHDADVSLFLGDRQYARTGWGGEHDTFKASVYLHTANHGQFNTVWGRLDLAPPLSWFLNTRPIMDGDAQRQAGKVFVTAFLEATLTGEHAYRALFLDHRTAAPWLPDTLYVTRFQDASFRLVAGFEEDVDLTTTTVPGGRIEAEGLALWREGDVRLRGRTARNDHAVTLGWDARHHDAATYTITLPADLATSWELDGRSLLSFDLAATTEKLPERGGEGAAPEARGDLDLTVELIDAAGRAVSLPLGAFRPVAPPARVQFTKLPMLDRVRYQGDTEPLLQTYALPLAAFVEQGAAFDLSSLTALRLRFDRRPAGVVVLDHVGFARAGEGTTWSVSTPVARRR